MNKCLRRAGWSLISRALEHEGVVVLVPRDRHHWHRLGSRARVRHLANISNQQAHALVRLQYLNRLVVRCLLEALAVNLQYLITNLYPIFSLLLFYLQYASRTRQSFTNVFQ